MTTDEQNELEFLRYFYAHADEGMGPASDDIYDMIKQNWRDDGHVIPVGYGRHNDDSSPNAEDYDLALRSPDYTFTFHLTGGEDRYARLLEDDRFEVYTYQAMELGYPGETVHVKLIDTEERYAEEG